MRDIILERTKGKIIVALDTDSPEKAMDTVKSLTGEVGMFKVGMELFPRGGPKLVRNIMKEGFDVFLDLKFKDIPNTVAGAIRSMVDLGVKFCTVHADGGMKMLKAAADAAEGSNLIILAVTVLTSLNDEDLQKIGYAYSVKAEVRRLAAQAVSCGIKGLVSSAQETPELRAMIGSHVIIVNPGIRLAGGDAADQKRVVTPGEAIRNGANYIVVGRPITQTVDPAAAARKFASAIAQEMHERSGG